MLGISAEMSEIIKICKKKNISIIEDTAWGCGGVYGNKKLGTIGRMGTYSFDFAKLITTGEGGMISFNHKKDYLYAKAWHDHGHENNPKVPRWEDTRKSSGFNFRMTELQAAVGIAQLKKLKKILKLQRLNKKKIWDKIKKLDIVHRKIPKKNKDTCDALIFFTKSKKKALKCKKILNNNGVYTKILPEALKWHFAKYWSHMPELKKKFKVKVGYSDHTTSSKVAIAAIALGAKVIEKHFTISKKLTGPDHKASVDVNELKRFVKEIRETEILLGKPKKIISRQEISNKFFVRKTIVASRFIKKGEKFTESNLACKRPEGGISPIFWKKVIGKKATKDFKKDQNISL